MKVGDLVIWTTRSGSFSTIESWAKVTNVTPKGTVTAVGLDDRGIANEFRPSRTWKGPNGEPKYHGLRPATEHEIAMRTWWAAKPKTQLVYVGAGLGSRIHDEARLSVQVDLGLDRHDESERIDRLLTAAAELRLVADWMRVRPVLATDKPNPEEHDDADE